MAAHGGTSFYWPPSPVCSQRNLRKSQHVHVSLSARIARGPDPSAWPQGASGVRSCTALHPDPAPCRSSPSLSFSNWESARLARGGARLGLPQAGRSLSRRGRRAGCPGRLCSAPASCRHHSSASFSLGCLEGAAPPRALHGVETMPGPRALEPSGPKSGTHGESSDFSDVCHCAASTQSQRACRPEEGTLPGGRRLLPISRRFSVLVTSICTIF